MSGVIRPMTKADLPEARRICRTAFGTFLGAPDPENFWADRDYVYGRFAAEHVASFAAEQDGELVGSNFATRWGSFGFFGPITMRPARQGQGIGKALVEAVSNQFEDWGVSHAGLCTFPQSPLHIALYGKFGFRARFLNPIMALPAQPAGDAGSWSRYSELPEGDRPAVEAACRELTDMLYDGLDLGAEIRTAAARGLGDTLLLREGASRLAGFAVCHWGPASEAGEAAALSNSARCGRAPGTRRASPRCSTAAARWPRRSACRPSSPASILPARRPICRWWRTASAPKSKSSRCTGRTSRPSAGPASTSSTTGGSSRAFKGRALGCRGLPG
jgi:GNAT superfamily N-acetyltransferase